MTQLNPTPESKRAICNQCGGVVEYPNVNCSNPRHPKYEPAPAPQSETNKDSVTTATPGNSTQPEDSNSTEIEGIKPQPEAGISLKPEQKEVTVKITNTLKKRAPKIEPEPPAQDGAQVEGLDGDELLLLFGESERAAVHYFDSWMNEQAHKEVLECRQDIRVAIATTTREAYERGRVAEAKTCAEQQRHDVKDCACNDEGPCKLHGEKLEKWLRRERDMAYERADGCPCLLVKPCSNSCSCATPTMPGGCDRCAKYGSLGQRKAQAKRLAERGNGEAGK